MSYFDDEDDEDLFTKMMHLRDMIADVPREADIVSAQTREVVNQVGREVSKVIPPQRRVARRIPRPELPATPAPELPQTTQPVVPQVMQPQIPSKVLRRNVYGSFAGRRKRMPDTLSIFMGRRRRK